MFSFFSKKEEEVSSNSTDPVFNAKEHTIIDIASIFKNDAKETAKLSQEFKTKGWCILRLPKDDAVTAHRSRDSGKVGFGAIKYSPAVVDTLSHFFSKDEVEKVETAGYTAVPHKESLHYTTPHYEDSVTTKLTPALYQLTKTWMYFSDQVGMDLIEIFATSLFNCDAATLSHRAELPVAFHKMQSMVDIAFYKNTKTATISPDVGSSTEDVNCVAHYDPGLLSLSFLSTHDGLQLQDPTTGKWYAGPVNTRKGQEDLAVMWLGSAAVTASKGGFKAGVHRVVYPQTKVPRIAAWFELCSVDQVNEEIKSTLPATGNVTIPNLMQSNELTLQGDVKLIEKHFGVPMSKVMRRSDDFAAYYSKDKPAAAKNE